MKKFYQSTIGISLSLALFAITMICLNMNVTSSNPSEKKILRFVDRDQLVAELITLPVPADTLNLQRSSEPVRSYSFAKGAITLNQNPKLLIWIMLFALMSSVSCLFLFSTWNQLRLHDLPREPSTRVAISVSIALCLLIVVPLAVNNFQPSSVKKYLAPFDIIAYLDVLFFKSVLHIIYFDTTLSFLAGGLSFFGILLINMRICRESVETMTKEKFDFYNRSLNYYLSVCSTLIVFSVLLLSFIFQALAGAVEVRGANLFNTEFLY